MALHAVDDSLTLEDPVTLLADSYFDKEPHVGMSVLASIGLVVSSQF